MHCNCIFRSRFSSFLSLLCSLPRYPPSLPLFLLPPSPSPHLSLSISAYSLVFRITEYHDTDSRNPGHTLEIRENPVVSFPPPRLAYATDWLLSDLLVLYNGDGMIRDVPPNSRLDTSAFVFGFPPLYINIQTYRTWCDEPTDVQYLFLERTSQILPTCGYNLTVAFEHINVNNIGSKWFDNNPLT